MLSATTMAIAGLGGAAAATWAAMAPSSQLFGPTLRHTGDARKLALTFDDGPNPAVTPRLLDLLARHDVRATFFLIGRHVRACPELVREIAARGHVVANHTETHPYLIWLSASRIREELDRCQEAIAAAAGRPARWMRPPYGARSPLLRRIVRQGGWAGVVMWSLWLWDWKPQPAEPVIRRLRRARGGDIVLMHDGDPRSLEGDRRHAVRALEHWLPRWKDAGLEMVTLDQIAAGGQARSAAGGR